ncbi:MAG: hypothetical protein QW193_03505 [Nitrososphaerales archaeon]
MFLHIKAVIQSFFWQIETTTSILCLLPKASTIVSYSGMIITPVPVATLSNSASLRSSSSAIEVGITVLEATKSMCALTSLAIFPIILMVTIERLFLYGNFMRRT